MNEGIIQYQLDFELGNAPEDKWVTQLNAWRSVLFQLGFTGYHPLRYGGLAYGNVSCRLFRNSFLISGTQTGKLAYLDSTHYCYITDFNIELYYLRAKGCILPSSEAMTHAVVYHSCDTINCIFHIHAPRLWQHAEILGIPITDQNASYGTQNMANAIKELCLTRSGTSVFAMGGHEDGLLIIGATIENTVLSLFHTLDRLYRLYRYPSLTML